MTTRAALAFWTGLLAASLAFDAPMGATGQLQNGTAFSVTENGDWSPLNTSYRGAKGRRGNRAQ
jgi:hypothetical protein